MKFWKAALGVGAACVACCAVPVVGGLGAMATGATTLAATGAALLPCANELAPWAGVLIVIAAGVGGMALWRRRRQSVSGCAPSCGGGCHVDAE